MLVLIALVMLAAAAVLAAALLLVRRRPATAAPQPQPQPQPLPEAAPVRVLAEAAPAAATISGEVDPIAALDALLAELEGATVRIDGADELDESAVVELELLADKLEAAAATLERVG